MANLADDPRVSIPLKQYDELCDQARKTADLKRQLDAIREAFEDFRRAVQPDLFP